MPAESWTASMSESTLEVLEKMFFTSPLDEPVEQPADSEPPLAVRLRFRGEPSGTLILHLSPPSARSLAANFFGAEPEEVTPMQVEQVAGELANMLCGCLLSHVASQGQFALSSPEALQGEAWKDGPLTCAFSLEDGILGIRLELDEPTR